MCPQPASELAESEQQLISRAQLAVSQCNWVVGECAHKWTQKYARGRGDGDFATLLGLSVDQVYQRRRVWETFADVRESYKSLKWSHFYAALNWDDAPECLQWADENEATVAEMKAWRRALRGEDLTVEAVADEWGQGIVNFVPETAVAVRDPGEFGDQPRREGSGRGERSEVETVSGVARDAGDGGYAPYRSGAVTPPPRDSDSSPPTQRPTLPPEQLITRMSSSLERINEALTPEVLKALKSFPDKKRTRFLKAVSALGSKVARFM